MSADVAGSRGALFGLVARTTGLSVITLGVYSFWARTRVRRWLWSAVRIGDTPVEYVGQPLEKLMGFVIAAVMVAVYLGLIVMVLIFASLNIWGGPEVGIAASFALLAPVFWFAQYRGMRYLLNHTRWRGIGFSMAQGAWGYSGRAILWTILSVLTAGLLWPVRTHRLWAYRAERTYYGDDHFRLTLSAGALYRPFVAALLGIWLTAFAAILSETSDGAWGGLFVIGLPLAFFGWVHWRVASFRLLVSSLQYAGATELTVRPQTGRVIRIHLLGWLVVGILLFVALIAAMFGFGAALLSSLPDFSDGATGWEPNPYLVAGGAVLFYLTFFLGRGALKMVFVTYPLIAHVAETLTIKGAAEVNAVRAGEKHHMADADGFANLFDLGSGI